MRMTGKFVLLFAAMLALFLGQAASPTLPAGYERCAANGGYG